ncbi:hypothetical protein N177_3732 [Lutibaculum baratangense AMV1]|uniref:Uncharacterized protein n=1 Tax=Lutibaculum baratangense AMV1 TaxID=631454 RepID=V4R8T8_9HYPH|nr:hypothetical protein N177_3732 [Lutibaculum baratangense AMV1]
MGPSDPARARSRKREQPDGAGEGLADRAETDASIIRMGDVPRELNTFVTTLGARRQYTMKPEAIECVVLSRRRQKGNRAHERITCAGPHRGWREYPCSHAVPHSSRLPPFARVDSCL